MNEVIEKENRIESILTNVGSFLEKGYLEKRETFSIAPVPEEVEKSYLGHGIGILEINKIVLDNNENMLDKLSNIYSALYSNESSIFLILDSDGKECKFYLGVKNKNNRNVAQSILMSSLDGNFPGVEYKELDKCKIGELLKNNFGNLKDIAEITTVTGVPSYLLQDKGEFVQGIEKLINGMKNVEFSCIILANPLLYKEIQARKEGYENLYNNIYPYRENTITVNYQQTSNFTQSESRSIAEGIVQSLSQTTGSSDTISNALTKSKGSGISANLSISGIIEGVLSIGGSVGISRNKGEANTESTSISKSKSIGTSNGRSITESKQEGTSETIGESEGKSWQIKTINKKAVTLTEKIEQHLERFNEAEGDGLWEVGVFFVSKKILNSLVAASTFNGIIRGKHSGIEKNNIFVFNEIEDKRNLLNYLYNVEIPKMKIPFNNKNTLETTMGTVVTTDELVLELNFPKESVAGIDVVEMASFARNNNYKTENQIEIGRLYHLGKEMPQAINLDIDTLSAHTFITGSTGSGKSNTVYTLVEKLLEKNIKFLIVEPAKGEYKNVFGGRDDFKVYGTNRKISQLLKINPFSFNKNIHILEHIDRLVEIFNACWPMYAAMPAILKEAIEKSYIRKGWDLKESINLYGKEEYPTFNLLKRVLEDVINSSSYSGETKGNYKGALITRVSSLENGLLGNIFSDEEIKEQELFDSNVIVDISRVPSIETKSLLMGILFMKLYEYRLGNFSGENQSLKHITILEEAHNLLKRTSLEQSQEGSNLQGKSVEMMTNAIAEMRTYGEGFVIVDQAPELLDLSVIRNTNTKICLKLPNYSDRELVGKAMNLNSQQIEELAKLDVGVGAVIQSGWKESGLVKFYYMGKREEFIYDSKELDSEVKKQIIKILWHNKLPENERRDRNYIVDKRYQEKIENYFKERKICYENLREIDKENIIFELINGKEILDVVNQVEENERGVQIEKILRYLLKIIDEKYLIVLLIKLLEKYMLVNKEGKNI